MIRATGPITITNIEARNKLRSKLQTHGLMACSMLLLAMYMRFSFPWLWLLVFSLIGGLFIYNWLSNLFGDIVEYTSLPIIEKFGLYLRPFSTDIDKEKHKLELLLAKRFSSVCRLFSIGNPYEIFNIKGATTIYATDQSWKNVIVDMMAKASYVLLRVHYSEGTLWELDTCFNKGHVHKTVFIIDNEDSLHQLSTHVRNYYHIELKSPVIVPFPCAVLLGDINNEKSHFLPLDNVSSVKALFDSCIATNVELRREKERLKNNRSGILKHIFNKKLIPAGIGCIDLSYFLNPYLYIIYNRWPLWLFLSPLAAECIALIINRYFLYSAPWIPFVTMLLWIYCFSLFFIISVFPKRISWLSRNWPSVEYFEYENLIIRSSVTAMTLSMLWYFVCINTLIYICTGCLIQLR